MKRVLIVFLVCCVLLSSFPSVALADQPSDEEIAAGLAVPSDSIMASRDSRSLSFEQYSSTRSLSLSDGTYYLNNRGCGKYLRYYSSALALTNGYVSTYGNSIKWKITSVSGGYTISSVSSSTKYLGVPSSTSSNTIELVTVSSGSSIPARCIWTFEVADGGCFVKNTYNAKYLYVYANNLRTATSIAKPQTEDYYYYVWRVAKESLLSGKELTSVSIADVKLYAGEQGTLSLSKTPSSAYWATATDFAYTGLNINYVRVDGYTGDITASSTLTTFYSSTVTATHKVTGISTTFLVVVNPRAALLNVPATGHDHSTCLTEIMTYILECGYGGSLKHDGTIVKSDLENILSSEMNTIFVSRSHGGGAY